MGSVSAYKMLMVFSWRWNRKLTKEMDLVRELVMASGQVMWKRTFRLTYGHDSMSAETRDALLFGQLQEGLKYGLMERPAVSGATSYLYLPRVKSTDRQLLRNASSTYHGDHPPSSRGPSRPPSKPPGTGGAPNQAKPGMNTKDAVWKCWNCDKVGHLAKDCWKPKKESIGRTSQNPPSAKMVHSVEDATQLAVTDDPMTTSSQIQMSVRSDKFVCRIKGVYTNRQE